MNFDYLRRDDNDTITDVTPPWNKVSLVPALPHNFFFLVKPINYYNIKLKPINTYFQH